LVDYRIFETERFTKDLRAIAKGGHTRIESKLREVVVGTFRTFHYRGTWRWDDSSMRTGSLRALTRSPQGRYRSPPVES
jgi:hypothetical protein